MDSKYEVLLQKLATQSQVDKLQSLLAKEHADAIDQLGIFIQDAHFKHNRALRRLELQRTDLTSTLAHFHSALGAVADSHSVAKRAQADINRADSERLLVQSTLRFVTQVRALKNHIAVAHEALNGADDVTAARCIQQIRELDSHVIRSQFAKRVVPSSQVPEEPQVLVDQWCARLTGVFRQRFLDAADRQDVDQLTLTFQMFPLIGEGTLGLDLYSKYVCDIIASQSRKIMTGEHRRPGVFAQALLHLCRIVSTVINNHSQIIASCYGLEHMVHVMEKVEREVDLQAGLVLDVFTEARRLQRVVQAAHDDGARDDSPTISELSSLVTELSQILQNWSMYSLFFSVRWYEFRKEQPCPLQPPPPIVNGPFAAKLNDEKILSNFQILVVQYLQRSFDKSLALEELPALDDLIVSKSVNHADLSNLPISSVLEDLSVLIKKALILTVNTGQTEVLLHFLDQLAKFYQNEFLIRFMQNKFRDLHSKLGSTLFLKKVDPPPQTVGERVPGERAPGARAAAPTKLSQLGFNFRGAAANAFTNIQSNLQAVVSDNESVMCLRHYLIYVNTLYLNVRFVHRLLTVEILEENPRLLHDNFPFDDDSQKLSKRIHACEELIVRQNNKLQQWCIKILFESVFLGRIRTLISSVLTNGSEDNYVSNADNFEDLSNVNEFVSRWRLTMGPFQNVFCPDAYAQLLSFVVDTVVATLEQRIWTLQVNELGATKLDRELSLLISAICSTNYTLREKFTKLTQLVLVLGFDDDDFDVDSGDIKEEIDNGMNWAISPQDRIKIRDLKIDKRH